MALTYDPIATTTLNGSTDTITFNSIPGTYTDLKVVIVANGVFIPIYARFNSDSAANYSVVGLYGDGATVTAFNNNNRNWLDIYNISLAEWNLFTLDVFSYSGSTQKTVMTIAAQDKNGSGSVCRFISLWRNTAAITSLTLSTLGNGNFSNGTIATLYGIKAA